VGKEDGWRGWSDIVKFYLWVAQETKLDHNDRRRQRVTVGWWAVVDRRDGVLPTCRPGLGSGNDMIGEAHDRAGGKRRCPPCMGTA
jgi:hypothetical protein